MYRKSIPIILWIVTGLWSVLPVSNLWASCGSANCFLVTGTQEGIATPGGVTLDISYRYIPMDDFHKGSNNTNEAVVPKVDFENGIIIADHHREVRTVNELMQVDLSYGITERFTLQVALPLINNRSHEHFDEVGTPDEFFSRQDGSSGIGDLRLIGKYAAVVRTRHLVVVGGGLKLPTGEYKLLDSKGEINEPTIMPGTGSYDFVFNLFYDYQVIPHKLDAFFSGSYQLNTENDLDYEQGDQTLLNTGVNYLLTEKVSVSGQVNFRFSPRDEFKGQEVASTGGTWINITPGINVQASDRLGLYTFVQIPVFQDVNEVNLVARYGLALGATYSF
ncbi:MAG: transporter [Nitrospiria bacterium]